MINAILVWPLALLLTPFDKVGLDGILILVFAGLLAPTLGRLLRFMSVDKLGVAPAAPFIATAPLFSSTLAVLFLGEHLSLQIGLGTLAIVVGIMILSREERSKFTKIGVIVAVGSAFCFGTADVIRKVGATAVSSPTLGAAMGATIASIIYIVFARGMSQPINSPLKWNRFNVLNGILTGFAITFTFAALFVEKVVIVEPLIQTSPLFTLIFTKFFLGKLERVTATIYFAAVMVVVGGVLISTG